MKREEIEDIAQKQARHTVRNIMTTQQFDMAEIQKELALSAQDRGHIKEKMDNLETKMEEFSNNFKEAIKEFSEDIKSTYATKEEHNTNRDKISFIYKVFYAIGSVILLSVLGALLNLINL